MWLLEINLVSKKIVLFKRNKEKLRLLLRLINKYICRSLRVLFIISLLNKAIRIINSCIKNWNNRKDLRVLVVLWDKWMILNVQLTHHLKKILPILLNNWIPILTIWVEVQLNLRIFTKFCKKGRPIKAKILIWNIVIILGWKKMN